MRSFGNKFEKTLRKYVPHIWIHAVCDLPSLNIKTKETIEKNRQRRWPSGLRLRACILVLIQVHGFEYWLAFVEIFFRGFFERRRLGGTQRHNTPIAVLEITRFCRMRNLMRKLKHNPEEIVGATITLYSHTLTHWHTRSTRR